MRQTHKNVEVIVVDDGSEDNTLEVAKSYAEKDSRLRVFHKENGGVSSARNMGIREAHGEYITFLDSDDWFEDSAVEVLLDIQLKYLDRLIAGEIYNVHISGNGDQKFFKRVLRSKVPSSDILIQDIEESVYTFFSLVLANNHSKIFRRDIICKYNPKFKEGTHYGEDRLFLFSYLQKTCGTVFISKPVVCVFERKDSAIRKAYDERKIFKDGNFIDYAQDMIDIAETPELKNVFKVHHTLQIMSELSMAVRTKVSGKKFKLLQKIVKKYQHNFFVSKHVTFMRKLDFLCGAYLPVPLARFTMLAMRYVNDTIKAFKNSNKKEEILPYW